MAEMIVDLLSKKMRLEEGRNFSSCQTKHLPISGGAVGGTVQFFTYVSKQINKGVELGLTKSEAKNLVRTYGSNFENVFHLLADNKEIAKKYELPLDLFASLCHRT